MIADFCLERLPGVTGDVSLTLEIAKNMGLIDPEVFLALSEGLVYVKGSASNHIEPKLSKEMLAVKLGNVHKITLRLKTLEGAIPDKEIRSIRYFDTHKSKNQRSDIVQVSFVTGKRGKITQIVEAEDCVSIEPVGGGEAPVVAGDYNWTKQTRQHGLKYVIDNFDDTKYSSWTDLIGATIRYDINEKLAVGLQGSVLHSYTAKNYDYGLGAFVEVSPPKDTAFTFGYNTEGFDDEDFSRQNYHQEGAYFKLKIKFGQESIKSVAKGAVK